MPTLVMDIRQVILLVLAVVAGVQGRPDISEVCTQAADIVFVLDSSNSIDKDEFKRQLRFVQDVVKMFDVGQGPMQVRVGILTFGNTVWIDYRLDTFQDLESLIDAVDKIERKNGTTTNTSAALDTLRTQMFIPEMGSRLNVSRIAIVITDGGSQNKQGTKESAEAVHNASINIFAIGVGREIDLVELEYIATDPDKEFLFKLDNYSALESIKRIIANKACQVTIKTVILPSTTPTTKSQSNGDAIITVTQMRAIPHISTSQPKPQGDRDHEVTICTPAVETDLLFTYDSVIGSWKSEIVTQFIGALVNGFERNGLVRVGRLTSDWHRSGNIALTYELSNVAFSRLDFTTNTHLIRKVQRHGFSVEQGGLPKARRFAVMVVYELEEVNSEMISDVQKLNKKAEVYLILVGKANNMPLVHELEMVKDVLDQGHIINVDSYQKIFSVKGELLGRLCRFMSSNEITRD